jgi:hypothetical protein
MTVLRLLFDGMIALAALRTALPLLLERASG